MIAYFDCFSGISGDMTLGALVDAGVPVEEIRKGLSCLAVTGYGLKARTVKRAGLSASKVDVILERRKQKTGNRQTTETRKWKDVQKIVNSSSLSKSIKQKGLFIFKRLFEAEAAVHGGRFDNVHLHELGAVDCIVDIFGSLIGLDALGIDTIYSSPLNLGSGSVRSEHGFLPVPAPASVELLKGVPVYSSNVSFELTTPTGAALISSLASGFGRMPAMNISVTGRGAGNKNFKEHPNILRIFVGEAAGIGSGEPGAGRSEDDVTVIETNIDDMNPQVYDHVMCLLFEAGALDVYLTSIMMKKNRPGIKLTALTARENRDKIIDIILRETTSIGLRFYNAGRRTLQREFKSVKTKFGKVNIKVSRLGKKGKTSVEYEDCRKIAKEFNLPLLDVINILSRR